MSDDDTWNHSFCVQCGPDCPVDEDGLCASCGADAVGEWGEKAVEALEEYVGLRKENVELRKIIRQLLNRLHTTCSEKRKNCCICQARDILARKP